MNNIDFEIQNNEGIIFNTEENNNINFESDIIEDTINMDIGDDNQEANMEINSSNRNINFDMGGIPTTYIDYRKAVNKPSINSVVLIDDKTSEDLGLQPAGDYANTKISNIEIDALFR